MLVKTFRVIGVAIGMSSAPMILWADVIVNPLVTIYKDEQYEGESIVLSKISKTYNVADLGSVGSQSSSLKVGRDDIKVKACTGANLTGTCDTYYTDNSDINGALGKDRQYSSFLVENNLEGAPLVTIFKDWHYEGIPSALTVKNSTYNVTNDRSLGYQASSFKISDKLKLKACTGTDLTGDCDTYYGDAHYVGEERNDTYHSFIVEDDTETETRLATLYLDFHYEGRQSELTMKNHTYNVTGKNSLGYQTSSFKIKDKLKLKACTGTDLSGDCDTYFEDNHYVGDERNDTYHSFIVEDDTEAEDLLVTLYKDFHYEGVQYQIREKNHTYNVVGKSSVGYQTSSLKVVADKIRLKACTGTDLSGDCDIYYRDSNYVGSQRNDKYQSFIVEDDTDGGLLVTLYRDENYEGLPSQLMMKNHTYNVTDASSVGYGTSSLRVVDDMVKIKACTETDLSGECDTYYQDSNINAERNDKYLSFIVEDLLEGTPLVKLYEGEDYTGKSKTLIKKGETFSTDVNYKSVFMVDSVRLEACEGANLKEPCQFYDTSNRSIGNSWTTKYQSYVVSDRKDTEPLARLYTAPNYEGSFYTIKKTDHLRDISPTVASIRLNGVHLKACTGYALSGNCDTIYEDNSWIASKQYKSYIVVKDSADSTPLVRLFKEPDYKGSPDSLTVKNKIYTVTDKSSLGYGMSSLKVADGVQLKACLGLKLKGGCETYYGDTYFIGNDNNNKYLSFIVEDQKPSVR